MAPYLRADLHSLLVEREAWITRLNCLEEQNRSLSDQLSALREEVAVIRQHMPAVLNAIASTNGTSRLLARRVDLLDDDLRDRVTAAELDAAIRETTAAHRTSLSTELAVVHAATQHGDDSVRREMRPHIDTIGFLLQRVETIRAEFMHELRYGADSAAESVEPRILNPAVLVGDDLKVNLGAGHLVLEGYINVDMRELPGIDVIAPADGMPFEVESLQELFSSHTVEHFPEQQLRRSLLPYWRSLLRPGGRLRAIVPDIEAMTAGYVAGTLSFDQLRGVLYGGQEYEGDFHFTGFTPASFTELLVAAGFDDVEVLAAGRPNGDCLEFEIVGTRPN